MMEEYVALTEDTILEGAVPQKINHGGNSPTEELSSKEVAPTKKPMRELAMLMAMDTELAGGPHLSGAMWEER